MRSLWVRRKRRQPSNKKLNGKSNEHEEVVFEVKLAIDNNDFRHPQVTKVMRINRTVGTTSDNAAIAASTATDAGTDAAIAAPTGGTQALGASGSKSENDAIAAGQGAVKKGATQKETGHETWWQKPFGNVDAANVVWNFSGSEHSNAFAHVLRINNRDLVAANKRIADDNRDVDEPRRRPMLQYNCHVVFKDISNLVVGNFTGMTNYCSTVQSAMLARMTGSHSRRGACCLSEC